MATSPDIIKELLIAIGWTHDESSRRKMVDAEQKTTRELEKEQKSRDVFDKKRKESSREALKGFAEMTAGIAAAAGVVVAALGKMGSAFEQAFYSASRTGSSVRDLKNFQYAMSQMGSTAEEANQAVEGLTAALKDRPGLETILRDHGATGPRNAAKWLEQTAPWLASLPDTTSRRYAEMFHMPEKVWYAMHRVDEMRSRMQESDKKYGLLGFEPGKAAEDGKALTQAFRGLYDTMADIGEKTGSSLFKELQPHIESLNAWLLAHGKELSEALTRIGVALFNMFEYVVKHLPDLDKFATSMGGWQNVLTALAAIVSASMVARFVSLLAALRGLALLPTPSAWVLAALGIGAASLARAQSHPEELGSSPLPEVEAGAESSVHDDGKNGVFRRIWNWGKRTFGFDNGNPSNDKRSVNPGNEKTFRESWNFWKSKGVSDAYAAAMVAMEKGESGGDIHSVGDGGAAHGLFQHHPDRRADIQQGTGVVMGEDSHLKQLEGAYWELTQGHDAGAREAHRRMMEAKDQAEAVAAAVNFFERPKFKGKAIGERTPTANWAVGAFGGVKVPGPGDAGYKPPVPKILPLPKLPGKNPYSGLGDLSGVRPLFTSPTIGGQTSFMNKPVSMNQTVNNTITGVSDPTAAAAHVGARMNRSNSMLFRNLQSAVG